MTGLNDWRTAAAIACAGGFAAAVLTLPPARAWFRRRGWVDDPGARKIHGEPTLLAGGVAVLLGLLAALAVVEWGRQTGAWLNSPGSDGGPGSLGLGDGFRDPAWLLAGTAVMLFLLGWWDDVVELRPLGKWIGQLVVALLVVGSGVRLPWFGAWPVVQWLVSGLFFLAVVNAVNFLDNMNGLCAGLGGLAAIQLGLIGGNLGQPALSVACWGLAGACLGFLPFNYPRASAFLGDSGSQLIGGGMAVLTMLACGAATDQPGAGKGAGLAPLAVLAVPAFDLVQVVVGRLRRGQPIYIGDTHHVSHQLARRGFSRPMSVLILWIAAALAGFVGVWWSR